MQDMIPLSQYFSGVVTKKMFLDCVHQIVQRMKYCEKNMVSSSNLALQSNMIFVDSHTKEVKCIFWPIVNNKSGDSPYLFFRQLPYDLHFYQYECKAYLETYKSFFDVNEPFSTNSFDRMLKRLLGQNQSNSIETPKEKNRTNFQNIESEYVDVKSIGIEYDPFATNDRQNNVSCGKLYAGDNYSNTVCPMCGGINKSNYNYCIYCGLKLKSLRAILYNDAPPAPQRPMQQMPPRTPSTQNAGFAIPGQPTPPVNQGIPQRVQPQQQQPVAPAHNVNIPANTPAPQQPVKTPPTLPNSQIPQGRAMNFGETTVLGAGNAIGETTVLGATPDTKVQPYLVRLKNNEKINIDKPVFRIGKERSYVDYFIADNSAISRSHANIISKGGEYFIVDTNSTNHTYVNGVMINSNVETKLTHKTRLRLANEEFELNLC